MFGFLKDIFSSESTAKAKTQRLKPSKKRRGIELLDDGWHETNFPYQATILNIQRANKSYGSTCEIAIRYIENGKYKDFIRLVNPNTKTFSFSNYHGLTLDDVTDSPAFPAVWNDLSTYFTNKNVVVYFADSHMKALTKTLERNHISIPEMNEIDLYDYFLKYHDSWESYSLDSVAEHLDTRSYPDAHNVKRTLTTIYEILEIMQQKQPGRLKKWFDIKK